MNAPSPGSEGFEVGNDVADQPAEFVKRLDHWAALKKTLAKEYYEGRLELCIGIEIKQSAEVCQYHTILRRALPEEGVLPQKLNPFDVSHLNRRDDELVFVHDIQVMDCTKGLVSSLIRFERPYVGFDTRDRPVYLSALDGTLKLGGASSERKVHAVPAVTLGFDQLNSGDIKGTSNVVDAVSDDARKMFRDFLANAKNVILLPRMLIVLDLDGIWLPAHEFPNFRAKFHDVAFRAL